LFAYGPADATASKNPIYLLPRLNQDWFNLSGTGKKCTVCFAPIQTQILDYVPAVQGGTEIKWNVYRPALQSLLKNIHSFVFLSVMITDIWSTENKRVYTLCGFDIKYFCDVIDNMFCTHLCIC